jgi:hypothetical protein
MQCAQSDYRSRHAGLRPDPLTASREGWNTTAGLFPHQRVAPALGLLHAVPRRKTQKAAACIKNALFYPTGCREWNALTLLRRNDSSLRNGFPFIRALVPARAIWGLAPDQDFISSGAVLCLDPVIRRTAIARIATSLATSRLRQLFYGRPIALHDLCIHRIRRRRRSSGVGNQYRRGCEGNGETRFVSWPRLGKFGHENFPRKLVRSTKYH